jgi:hypothetical protein
LCRWARWLGGAKQQGCNAQGEEHSLVIQWSITMEQSMRWFGELLPESAGCCVALVVHWFAFRC